MLTSRRCRKVFGNWSFVRIGAAIVLSATTLTSAYAGAGMLSCAGRWPGSTIAQRYGAAADDPHSGLSRNLLARRRRRKFATRDRRWLDHCHPVVQYDPYGVARYVTRHRLRIRGRRRLRMSRREHPVLTSVLVRRFCAAVLTPQARTS